MNEEEFEAWELNFLENGGFAQLMEDEDAPLPKWPRLKARDKDWLRSCGVKC